MILLSFDTEEFDVPREHGVDFTLEQGMAVSKVGTNRILDVLKEQGVKATFFCTGNFAENAPEVMQRIMDEGHEVACHGVDHWQPRLPTLPYRSRLWNVSLAGRFTDTVSPVCLPSAMKRLRRRAIAITLR